MALFSFGKKDKKPPEVSAPVAKTQPTPPKIQSPPPFASLPTVKPPQPTGLIPGITPAGSATTQPMAVPRPGAAGLKPARTGTANSTRSTQRIVLPTPPGARAASTKSLSNAATTGRINLPIGMILRCLPPEVLGSELSEFESSGAAATEIGLPMNMILGQLPSGKVEMTLQDLVPHFPAGFLQPTEAIASYLPTIISLPLMDVVMRIPPDLLALRPDQKDVDASVINMADPFTEEILREQAEAARRQSQPNIIEESQAPQEEFVPRDQAIATRPILETVAPPRRPTVDPLGPSRTAATTLGAPPMPPVAKLPTPPSPGGPRASQVLPGAPVRSFATPIPVPVASRASGPLPTVPPNPLPKSPSSSQSIAPVPPVPRHTGPIPAPPPPRHTTSLPVPRRRTGAIPTLSSLATPAPAPEAAIPTETAATDSATPAPDASADDLQRLAALAMAQLGESSEPIPETPSQPEAVASQAPVEEPAQESSATPEIAPAESAPSPEPLPVPLAVEAPAARTATSPLPAVAFNLNTCSKEDLVENIPGCSPTLAEAVVQHRTKIGSYKRLDELLDVPGMTKAAYTNLTGEAPPENRISMTLNELLNFPPTQDVSLKDVTDRIACWPDVTGCLLSQSSGLSLVGTAPEGIDKAAIVAFAPRMFESVNKSFSEVAGQSTDALLIPSLKTSFHLFRNNDLYLIIMSRLPQMPDRHMKVARMVLAELSNRKA